MAWLVRKHASLLFGIFDYMLGIFFLLLFLCGFLPIFMAWITSVLNFEFFGYDNSISALFIYLFNFSEFLNLECGFQFLNLDICRRLLWFWSPLMVCFFLNLIGISCEKFLTRENSWEWWNVHICLNFFFFWFHL